MSEETVFVPVDLPADGPDAVFFADLNVVGVRSGLTCKQRLDALTELQARWRRRHLHLVVSPRSPEQSEDPSAYAVPF